MKRDRETKGKVRIREAAKTEDGVQHEDKVRSLDSGRERYGRGRIRDKEASALILWQLCVCVREKPSVQGLLTLVMDILQTLGNYLQNVPEKVKRLTLGPG